MKITPGNTAVVDYLKADGGTPITITVEATNACGAVSLSAPINVSTGCPTITTATITPTGTITRFIDISGKPKTSGDSITSFRASAPNMTNPSDVTYAWTVNGVQQASPVTPTFTYVTPNVGGLYPVYAVASTTCEPVTSATTPTVNVRVIKDTPLDTSGTYRLNGKICYDVNRTDGTFANGCMPMSARKDDFASTKTFNYTFVSTAAFSDLFCYVIDPNDLIVSSSLNGNIFTVTFRNDINSVVTGRDKSSAFRLTLVAQYIDAKSNAQQVTLGVSVQDCFCCGSGGTAVPQTIGNNEYLTHLYMTGSVERCWMVENSREGTPTRTTYPKKAAGERGFYYTWGAVAQTACPAGWRVPSLKESEDLTFTLRAMVNNNNADNPRRFWSQEEHLAGVVSSGGSGNSWGEYGYWWTSVYLKSMHSYVKTTIGPYVVQIAETGWSFPIRCVQDN
jgi:uncharacterized protein (TIGR02145 family)